MTNMIPTAVAAQLIQAKLRDDALAANQMVLQEALSMLIGHLHRAGLVDAEHFVSELQAVFADPEIAQVFAQTPELAEGLAERIRAAAIETGEGMPEGK